MPHLSTSASYYGGTTVDDSVLGSTPYASTGDAGITASQYSAQILAMKQQAFEQRTVPQSPWARNQQQTAKKGSSMVDEFKSYVREYKDWIFTIAIVAIIDHFFLDGALKEKLSTALGKKLDADNGKV